MTAFLSGCATSGPWLDVDDVDGMNAELGRLEREIALEQLRKMPRRAGVLPAAELSGEFVEEIDSLQCAETHHPDSTRILAKKVPRGAYVLCRGSMFDRFEGTLLEVRKDKVKFQNCFCREAVDGPGGTKEARTTFAPSMEVDLAAVSQMEVVAVPHKSELPAIPHDVVDEVVFVSGRRRKVDVPPLPRWLMPVANEAEREEGRRQYGPHILLAAAPGSRVTVRDGDGRWYDATYVGADETNVRLQDCICAEAVAEGAPARVSYGYSQSVAIAQLLEAAVVGPPEVKPARSDEECDGCDYCVESFQLRGGSQRPLKWTRKVYTEEELAEINGGEEYRPIRAFGSVVDGEPGAN